MGPIYATLDDSRRAWTLAYSSLMYYIYVHALAPVAEMHAFSFILTFAAIVKIIS